jgi:hypothetical protein
VVTADAAGIAKAVEDGYKLSMQNLNDIEIYFDLASSGDVVTSTVAKGLEHVYIKSFGLKVARHGGLPFFYIADAEKNITQDGEVGLGLGKFIEESRRMATAANVMPYEQSHGGNDQGIDVRGKYTQYFFTASQDSTKPGWESHEFVDHAHVNADMLTQDRKYVIYANEADVDLIAELDKVFTS